MAAGESKWQKEKEEKEAKSQKNQNDDTALISLPIDISNSPHLPSQSVPLPFQTPPSYLPIEITPSPSPHSPYLTQNPFAKAPPSNPSSSSSPHTPKSCQSAGEHTQIIHPTRSKLTSLIIGTKNVLFRRRQKSSHRANLTPSPSSSTPSSSPGTPLRQGKQQRKKYKTKELQTVKTKRKGGTPAIDIPKKEELMTSSSFDTANSKEYPSTAESENQEANNLRKPWAEARHFLDSETTFMPQEVTNRQSTCEWVIQEGITIEETDDYVIVHSQYECNTLVTELEEHWLDVNFTDT